MRRKRTKDDVKIPSFLVDATLGTLARHLRMLGFDAEYGRRGDTEALIHRAVKEGRWFLTRRDISGATLSAARILEISDDQPDRQVMQIFQSIPMPLDDTLWFSRCLICNRMLEDISLEEAQGLVPDYIAQTHRHFRRCPSCTRVFWPGSHSLRMRRTMEEWLTKAEGKIDQKAHR